MTTTYSRYNRKEWREFPIRIPQYHSANNVAHSIAAFVSTVPWLGVYIGHIPGAARPLHELLSVGMKFGTARIQKGTQSRDLFHYFVSLQMRLWRRCAHSFCPLRTTKTSQTSHSRLVDSLLTTASWQLLLAQTPRLQRSPTFSIVSLEIPPYTTLCSRR